MKFNLLDEPWIRVRDTRLQVVSIRKLFQNADHYYNIVDNPIIVASLTRFLLVILHRAYDGPKNYDGWHELWRRGNFDYDTINRYLTKWSDRFDLFDDQYPFYQTTSAEYKNISIDEIRLEQASNVRFLENLNWENPNGLSPAESARWLIALQAYAVPITRHGSNSGPLGNCAALVLLDGDNLFETLMLNLIRYDALNNLPMRCCDDKPIWENQTVIQVNKETVKRNPNGWLDLLTWQSRQIKLQPAPIVRWIQIGPGYAFAYTERRRNYHEPMFAYSKVKDDEIPIYLTINREVWRDSNTILINDSDKLPKNILQFWEVSDRFKLDKQIRFSIYGMINKNAKINSIVRSVYPIPRQFDKNAESIIRSTLQYVEDLHNKINLYKFINFDKYSRIYWFKIGIYFKNFIIDPQSESLKFENIAEKVAKDVFNMMFDMLFRSTKINLDELCARRETLYNLISKRKQARTG